MAKLPEPDPERLARLPPELLRLPVGTPLVRIYFAAGRYPTRWNRMRPWGPAPGARFDHHLPDPNTGAPSEQERACLYAATEADTALAEVFQDTRVVDRYTASPMLVVFDTAMDLRLLDLSGSFATRMGASAAIATGPRDRAQRWARALYAAYPQVQGFGYRSAMNPAGHALVLNERASYALPPSPRLHRALSDPLLIDLVDAATHRLGYLKL